jgi:hypothetical protein
MIVSLNWSTRADDSRELTYAQRNSPSSSPSSSTSSPDMDTEHPVLVVHKDGPSDAQKDKALPYVQLDTDFAASLCWSNDPGQLALQTYFNPEKPSLGGDFQVDGLHPILLEDRGRGRFILMDSKDRFYVWSECDGPLYWVRHAEIEELASVEDKVDFILGGLGCLEVEPVCRSKHPADGPDLKTLREIFPKYRIQSWYRRRAEW